VLLFPFRYTGHVALVDDIASNFLFKGEFAHMRRSLQICLMPDSVPMQHMCLVYFLDEILQKMPPFNLT
jgi:hypothetical protein